MTVAELTASAEFEVPITFRNIDEGLALSEDIQKTVKVSVSGPASSVKAFNEDRIAATVDLYGYAAGTHTVPIRVTVDGRTNDDLTVSAETDTESVTLITAE